MPRVTLKKTITKEIEIPVSTLYEAIENLSKQERSKPIAMLTAKGVTRLKPFRKDSINSIVADFEATDLYEEDFLKDLEAGLKKSSLFK